MAIGQNCDKLGEFGWVFCGGGRVWLITCRSKVRVLNQCILAESRNTIKDPEPEPEPELKPKSKSKSKSKPIVR